MSGHTAMDSTSSVDKKLEREGSDHAYKPTVDTSDVDIAARLTAGKEISFTPEEAARLRCVLSSHFGLANSQLFSCRRKIDWHIMPLMCSKPALLFPLNFVN